MFKKEFDSTYVAFTTDGAQWLADNTDIKLVGKALAIGLHAPFSDLQTICFFGLQQCFWP